VIALKIMLHLLLVIWDKFKALQLIA
jgi:hypothetical protein